MGVEPRQDEKPVLRGSGVDNRRPASVSSHEVRVARGPAACELLDERWDALVRRQALPNPTLSSAWLRALVPAEHGQPVAIAVLSGEQMVAGAVFAVTPLGGKRGPTIARWLGNPASQRLPDVLVDPRDPVAAAALASALVDEAWGSHFGNVPLRGNLARMLTSAAPWTRVEARLEAVVATLPPPGLRRARKKARYYTRHAQRLGTTVAIDIHSVPDAVLAALERLFVLHEERWSRRSGAMRQFHTEAERQLYRCAIAALARGGNARIVEVREDGQLVASNLCLLSGRGAMFHTTATRVGGRLEGPGHVALLAMVENAREAGAETIYLGRGLSGPKRRMRPTLVPAGSLFVARGRGAQRILNAGLALERAHFAVRSRSSAQGRP